MEASPVPAHAPRVFRLRRIPNTARTFEDVAQVLSDAIEGLAKESIRIYSLATTVRPWENPPSRVATLMFVGPIAFLASSDAHKTQWTFPLRDQPGSLVLDTNFLGITPLNDVELAAHQAECGLS